MLAAKQSAAVKVTGTVNHGRPATLVIQDEPTTTGPGGLNRKSTKSKSTAQLNPVESTASGVHVATAPEVAHPILFHVVSGNQVGEEFLVHADCAVGVMMDFIKRRVIEDQVIPEGARLELFDETGESLGLHKSDPLARGTAFVKHRGVYFPMYFIPEIVDSDSDEVISSESSEGLVSSKKDLGSEASQVDAEWGGESPCEEDDIDEELQNPDGSEGKLQKKACVSSSASSTSVSSAGSHTGIHSFKSQSSTIPEEEYGEDGHLHHHHHPQMLHSKYQQEFCGEGPHDHHHHHHHNHQRTKSGNIHEKLAMDIAHDDPIHHPRRTSHPQDDHGHGPEFVGEGHEDQLGFHQIKKIPEKASQVKIKKEIPVQHHSDSKDSVIVSESAGKKINPGSKGGKRKDKFPSSKKSTPNHNVDFNEPPVSPEDEVDNPVVPQSPSSLSAISPLTDEIVQPEDMVEHPPPEATSVEPEVEEQSDFKTEDDGGTKITYIPIISDSFEGCVKVCQFIVEIHQEIDHGVQDTDTVLTFIETAVVPPAPAPPPAPQESGTLIVPLTRKATKLKSKANQNIKKPMKDAGGENSPT